jgi:hypothetical protein
LFGLLIFRPQGWGRFPLLAQSFMFLDLLFYTILPHWFGLRHFFFIGGDTPKPLNGASKEAPESMFSSGVSLFRLILMAVWRTSGKAYEARMVYAIFHRTPA